MSQSKRSGPLKSRVSHFRGYFESLESRQMLSADPQSLVADGYQPMQWHGQTVYAKPGNWIVQFNGVDGSATDQLTKADKKLAKQALKAQRQLGKDGLFLVQSDANESIDDVTSALKLTGGFGFVEPDFVLSADSIPNDPYFSLEYGLNNTGQNGGKVDADIDAPEAWDLYSGSVGAPVVTGVIDSGIDYTHPDIAGNMWTNPGETAGNGIDDDGNGYVDDIYGYDFINNDANPMDDNGHGTHVSGTISGVTNNGQGIAGVNYNGKLMALKFLGADGSGPLSSAVAAINYANKMRTQYGVNIRVTNNSWGGGGFSQSMSDAINASNTAGILFVAAAGNGGADQVGDNNDSLASYPSNYAPANVVAVAATDNNDNLASFSNYGASTVDLAAPGVSVASAWLSGGYAYASGTSMASPHVSGAASLAFSYSPAATPAQIKQALMSGVDSITSLAGKMVTGGRLNLLKTLQQTPVTVAPVTLSATASTTNGRIDLSWTDKSNNETSFLIERATPTGAFQQVASVGANVTTWSDMGLPDSTTYRYQVRASNATGITGYTNIATATTASPAPTKPAAPISLLATASAINGRIDLNWTDKSNNETSFVVERAPAGGAFASVVTLGADTTSWSNTGLADSTSYTYRVYASNGVGPSDYSNTSTATTAPAPVTTLAAPTQTAPAQSATGVSTTPSFTWSTVSGATSYRIMLATNPADLPTSNPNATTGGPSVQRNLSLVQPIWNVIAPLNTSATYYWAVRGESSTQGGTWSTVRSFTTAAAAQTLPAAPTGLSATAVSTSQINLAWTDNATNETSYTVQRSMGGGAFADVVTLAADSKSYNNIGLNELTTYTYRVLANNSAGGTPSGNATATTLAKPGDGLAATYYDNQDFTGTSRSRTDATVNFNWANGSPVTGIGADTFSVRWTGYVLPQYTQTYTFYTTSDDGVRLWVNGKLIIDKFFNQKKATEYSGTIALTAGQRYTIRMDYYDATGSASASLAWSSPSVTKAIIPQSRLYTTLPAAGSTSASQPTGIAASSSSPFSGTKISSSTGQSNANADDLDTLLGKSAAKSVFA